MNKQAALISSCFYCGVASLLMSIAVINATAAFTYITIGLGFLAASYVLVVSFNNPWN